MYFSILGDSAKTDICFENGIISNHRGEEIPAVWKSETLRLIILGDVNRDFKTDISDIVYIADVILQQGTIEAFPTADVNNDGRINILDMGYVACLILGKG
jgi:hypothetical protein